MSDKRPIGLFDSGVGGLSLLRELDNLMPYENYVYVGDTARMPYGTKTEEEIIQNAEEIIHFLEREKQCKLIVIACNTISGLLPEIETREKPRPPVVGMINYGAVAAALYVTYNFNIGVWATQRTIDSQVYQKFMNTFDPTVKLLTEPCTELVTLIEKGAVGSPTVRNLTEDYLSPMLREDIDTLVLGCTHLPFIRTIIQDVVTEAVTLIDPARRTAVLCMKLLHDNDSMLENHTEIGTKQFYVTGDPDSFKSTAKLLVGPMVDRVMNVRLGP
ncbi:MAG TPA: glutamate racemase [bacterium]|nr:glutamate racemase [bacterium]